MFYPNSHFLICDPKAAPEPWRLRMCFSVLVWPPPSSHPQGEVSPCTPQPLDLVQLAQPTPPWPPISPASPHPRFRPSPPQMLWGVPASPRAHELCQAAKQHHPQCRQTSRWLKATTCRCSQPVQDCPWSFIQPKIPEYELWGTVRRGGTLLPSAIAPDAQGKPWAPHSGRTGGWARRLGVASS